MRKLKLDGKHKVLATAAAGLVGLIVVERILSKPGHEMGPDGVELIPGVKYRYTYVFSTLPKGVPNHPELSGVKVSRPNDRTITIEGQYESALDVVKRRVKASTPLGNYESIVRRV